MSKLAAETQGKAALATLPDPHGWSVRVWENDGWHYALENGPITVQCGLRGFFCLIGGTVSETACGHPEWTTDTSFEKPWDAVQFELASVAACLRDKQTLVVKLNQVLGTALKDEKFLGGRWSSTFLAAERIQQIFKSLGA